MPEETNPTTKLFAAKYAWLRPFLKTDFLSLDDELSKISTLVQEAAECTAIAAEIRDTEKERLSTVFAEVSARLREAQLPNGKTRSETQISSEALLEPDYTKQQGIYSEARLDSSLWATMVDGFRTKSSSLRAAADLISAGYLTQTYILDKRKQSIRDASNAIPTR